jgi:hypothetical protein
MKTATAVHNLPGGGTIKVKVTAENPTPEQFPILRERNAIASAGALMGLADNLKASRPVN